MRKLLLLLLISICFSGFAQEDPEFVTSPTYIHNKPRLYNEGIFGEQNGVVYVIYSTEPVKATTMTNMSVKMYDKEDMTLVKTATLLPSNKVNDKKYEDFTLYDQVITSKEILFFFKKYGKKGQTDVYLTTYTLDMKQKRDIERVASYNYKETSFVGLAHGSYPNIVLAKMNKAKKNEKMHIEYQIIDKKDFEVVKAGKVNIPYETTVSGRGKQSFGGTFHLNSVGNIVTSINIVQKAQRTKGKKRKSKDDKFADKSHKAIVIIDTKTDDFLEVPIKLGSKINIDDFTWYTEDKKVTVVGFYSDRRKEKRGNEMHGIFHMTVDSEKGIQESVRTSEFPDDFLFRINSQNTLLSKRKRKKETQKESIGESFRITSSIVDAKERTLTIYCEPIVNSVTTYTDQNGATHTTYNSTRGSLFYFKIDEKGELRYYNSIRKKTAWSSGSSSVWYRKSMFVHRSADGKQDIVMYNTQRVYNERDKSDVSGKGAKWKRAKRDFVIATINNDNGNFDLNYPQEYSKKNKEFYGLYLNDIQEINGNLYTVTTMKKMRISRIVTAAVFFWTLYVPYIVMNSPKSYYEKVQLNRVEIQK